MKNCLCGGKLNFYDGYLGYEARVCADCNFHWDKHSKEEHEKQVIFFRSFNPTLKKDFNWEKVFDLNPVMV